MAEEFEVEEITPVEPSNRVFVLLAVGMFAMLFISLGCLAVYSLYWVPRQQAAQEAQQATEVALLTIDDTATAAAATLAAEPSETPFPDTATPTATFSPTATFTPVIVFPTGTGTPYGTEEAGPDETLTPETPDPADQTTETSTPDPASITPTATALPVTGFMDGQPLPQTALLAVALIVIIFAVRGMRARLNS